MVLVESEPPEDVALALTSKKPLTVSNGRPSPLHWRPWDFVLFCANWFAIASPLLLCVGGGLEGSPTPPFTNYRGIRQGDPLSPILFILIMDNLSRFIEKEVKDKKMDTYVVNGVVSISHLIYADDVLIFSKENPKSLGTIKKILESFSKCSKLEVKW